jgi:hypothetical protein
MPFKKGADGGLRWDPKAAQFEGRWTPKARRDEPRRCAWIEVAEDVIERGAITRVWDTLADPAYRPGNLTEEDERYIVRRALSRDAELGRLDGNMVAVLLRLIPGDDHLRGENQNKAAHRAIRVAIQTALQTGQDISVRKLAREHKVSRDTVARIRDDLLDPADD